MAALPPPTKFAPFPIETHDQRSLLGVNITFSILPVIAVLLRVLARRISKRALDPSDYCIIVAAVFAVGLEGVSISAVFHCGIGYDHTLPILLEYGMAPVTLLLKLLIPLQFLWALSLGFSKISILLLYKSVFAVPFVIWTARGAIVFIALWVLGTILAGCLICRPFPMNWDQTIPGGYCGDQVLSFTVTGVLNLLTDVMVLVLPLPYLARLQMRLYKKLVLIGVFSIGFLTCVVSAIRIYTLKSMDFADITYSLPPANIFSGLEPSMAVILACIPLLRPLLGRTAFSSGSGGATGEANGRLTPSNGLDSKLTAEDLKRPFEPLDDDSSQYRLRPLGPKHQAEASAAIKTMSVNSSAEESDLEEREARDRGIKVKSQWEVDVERR